MHFIENIVVFIDVIENLNNFMNPKLLPNTF
jgi:hypothetical protein